MDITQVLRQPESETFDQKGALDPTSPQDYLELAADLVSMANSRRRTAAPLLGCDTSLTNANYRRKPSCLLTVARGLLGLVDGKLQGGSSLESSRSLHRRKVCKFFQGEISLP